MTRILAIETSCDETAAAVVEGDGEGPARALSNTIASQVALHAKYGGVFPNLAAREHARRIIPVITLALHEAGLVDAVPAAGRVIERALESIDAIAVTVGPGLIGPLLIGTAAAQELAHLRGKPLIPINHWEGHLYSVFLKDAEITNHQLPITNLPTFPMLALTVSGGHTSLILMRDHFRYEILGSTIDDAAGEAFDKCARLLGLPYSGGPALSKIAALAHQSPITNHQSSITLPRPMLDRPNNLQFSFSGLKTAVRYAIDRGDIHLPADLDIAARAVEDAIVDVLIGKLERAIEYTSPASIAVVGGVSANTELRRRVTDLVSSRQVAVRSEPFAYPASPAGGRSPLTLYLPDMQFCTDNAAMIGAAGLFRFLRQEGIAPDPLTVTANASLRLQTN